MTCKECPCKCGKKGVTGCDIDERTQLIFKEEKKPKPLITRELVDEMVKEFTNGLLRSLQIGETKNEKKNS